ncbi:MAG: MFS transporter [Pseudomonadota bacterium]
MSTRISEITEISRWKHATRAFRHYNFSVFFAGQTISMLGTWSQIIAISWLVWRLTESAKWLGISNFVTHIPLLFFGLIGGVLADKYDRKFQMLITQSLLTLQAVIISILTLTGMISISYIIVLNIMIGVVLALEIPVRNAFTMDLVGKHDLVNAISIFSGMFHGTRLIGPVIAGFIVSRFGEGWCFGFNALTFLPLIFTILLVKRSGMVKMESTGDNFYKSLKEGLSFIKQNAELRLALFTIAIVAMVQFSYISLMPIFADKIFGGGAKQLGYLMAAGAFGALSGAWFLAQRRKEGRLLTLAMKHSFFFGIFLLVFALQKSIWPALIMLACVGYTVTVNFTAIHTLVQHIPPNRLRGRMVSLIITAFMGLAPFGSLGSGLLANKYGAPATIVLASVIIILISIFAYFKALKLEKIA